MEEGPYWEAGSCSAGQQIPCIIWNLKVCYHVYKNPSLIPILSQMNEPHTLTLYFKIYFNIILPLVARCSKWFLSFRFCDLIYICIYFLSHACYMPHPFHPPSFYHSNKVYWGVQNMKLLIMHLSPYSRYFLPFRFKYSPQHFDLKRSVCFLHLMWETKLHNHIQNGFLHFNHYVFG
jgi:hypothetical protein